MKKITYQKIRNRLWSKLVQICREKSIYPYIYRSFWHYLLHSNITTGNNIGYFTARPNPGAGIGHQIANWNAGYWFAKKFGLKFAHIAFTPLTWDSFLGFGYKEPSTIDLIKKEKYKIRKLPIFNEFDPESIKLIRQIIKSYSNKKIIFLCEQDQGYMDQYGVINDIKNKFYSAPSRKNDHLIYSKDNFNVAIHVRRGDIMTDSNNPNLVMRYLSNDYFEKVLKQVVNNIQTSKPIHIYFFSQGIPANYPEFSAFQNLHWCLDMNAQDSFLHLVYADLLITSKSSFSYKPALLNNGIKICPKNFWHGYPKSEDWILCENDGSFDIMNLRKLLNR
jgi:hypothetical protein